MPAIYYVSGRLHFKMADGTDCENHREERLAAGIFDNRVDTEEEKLERQHFWKVVQAFHFYK